jgi:phosphohistidine phosphatase
MPTLLLLRHAKSSWKDAGLEDHERPLNTRGRRDAPRVGELLAELDLVPGVVIGSTATRVRETVRAMVDRAGFGGEPVFDESLYQAAPDRIVEVIRRHGAAKADRLMIVGHNPGIEDLVAHLTGEFHSMPTAALARIVLPIGTWNDLRLESTGRLAGLWRPKELTG